MGWHAAPSAAGFARQARRPVHQHADVRPAATPRIAPDPQDDVVIGTALAAKAEMIVTGDKPLLSVTEHEGVRIVGVAQAIEVIDAHSST